MSSTNPITLSQHLHTLLPTNSRSRLRDAVLPTLIQSISTVARTLRTAHRVSAVGSANAFGDEQLNVDIRCEEAVREAIARCSGSIVAVSSEEDPVERHTEPTHNGSSSTDTATSSNGPDAKPNPNAAKDGDEVYTVAFDPLDGSSIIAANWTVGTIIGIWDGPSALNQDPATRQVAAILGVCGPRAAAIVALRLPGSKETCFEVALPSDSHPDNTSADGGGLEVIRQDIRLNDDSEGKASKKTRYFSPANLRAASSLPAYMTLITDYIARRYTLRYSGGLVPDIAHMLAKGHGIYLSPTDTTQEEKPKLRRLYELCPVALVVECAGGHAADPVDGTDVLARPIKDVEERGGLVCGVGGEAKAAMDVLLGRSKGKQAYGRARREVDGQE